MLLLSRLRCRLPSLLFLFLSSTLYTPILSAYQRKSDDDPKIGENVVEEGTMYVPLGNNVEFTCEAYRRMHNLVITTQTFNWTIFYPDVYGNDTLQYTPTPVYANSKVWKSKRFLANHSTGNLQAYALQRIHNNIIVECSIALIGNQTAISRVFVQMQDCGQPGESLNVLDPCRYGTCIVDNTTMPGLEFTRCHCVPQYTGQYCDQIVMTAIIMDFLFIVPILLLCLVVLIHSCCCRGDNRKVRVLRVARHVVPMDKSKLTHEYLFPASVCEVEEQKEPPNHKTEVPKDSQPATLATPINKVMQRKSHRSQREAPPPEKA